MKYLRLLRAHQWIKNIFVLLPLIFSGGFLVPEMIIRTFIACIAFSLVASGMYVMNDIRDLESDKKHCEKSKRPIASGEITVRKALLVGSLSLIAGIFAGYYLGILFLVVQMVYIITNAIYSYYGKSVVILDILLLALFYVIRVFAGAVAIDVVVSSWLFLTTFFLALFIGSGKRYVEFIMSDGKGRKVLENYTEEFLRFTLEMTAFATLLTYTIYSTTRSAIFEFTIIFVLIGFLIYFYKLFRGEIKEDPVLTLIKDKILILVIVVWASFALIAVYLTEIA